jgi:hypothetical protein
MQTAGTTYPRGRRLGRRLTIAFFLSLLVLGGVSVPAQADDTNISLTPATQKAEYGQGWELSGSIPVWSSCTTAPCDSGTMTVTTGSTTRTLPNFYIYQGNFSLGDQDLLPQTDLGVGVHSISLSFQDGLGPINTTTTPVSVTITPAAISENTTIAPDPNNSQNAIITSQLSGQYVDQLPSCQCEAQNGYVLPAGTWKLIVTDSSGKTVLAKQFDQPANGLPTYVNYWPSVPAGETFSAQSTFTVSGSAASNFALTPQKFSWTSGKNTTGGQAGTPSRTPRAKTLKTASFAPPLVVFYAALLVAIILIALDVLLLVLRRRSRITIPPAPKGAES